MRLWRSDQERLAELDDLHLDKGSEENVLHPPGTTEVFATPDDIRAAREDGALARFPARLPAAGLRAASNMGDLADKLDTPSSTYAALKPAALAAVRYLGAGAKAISGRSPLVVTSTVRDRRFQELLLAENDQATSGYSLHTTGYAFDFWRKYRSRAHAEAVQFMLDRLHALNLIAWVREPAAIHVTAAADAAALADRVDELGRRAGGT
jgi:hypothetical protein